MLGTLSCAQCVYIYIYIYVVYTHFTVMCARYMFTFLCSVQVHCKVVYLSCCTIRVHSGVHVTCSRVHIVCTVWYSHMHSIVYTLQVVQCIGGAQGTLLCIVHIHSLAEVHCTSCDHWCARVHSLVQRAWCAVVYIVCTLVQCIYCAFSCAHCCDIRIHDSVA